VQLDGVRTFSGELPGDLQLDPQRGARLSELRDVPFDPIESLLLRDVAFSPHVRGSIAGVGRFVTSSDGTTGSDSQRCALLRTNPH
jgi:hypothetical protein